jgi:FtsZ-interacting cell division protein ZipA
VDDAAGAVEAPALEPVDDIVLPVRHARIPVGVVVGLIAAVVALIVILLVTGSSSDVSEGEQVTAEASDKSKTEGSEPSAKDEASEPAPASETDSAEPAAASVDAAEEATTDAATPEETEADEVAKQPVVPKAAVRAWRPAPRKYYPPVKRTPPAVQRNNVRKPTQPASPSGKTNPASQVPDQLYF